MGGSRRRVGATTPAYFVHIVPGLEEIAVQELRSQPGDLRIIRTLQRFDERTSLLIFRYGGPAQALLRLRSAEDVFALAVEIQGVPADRKGLAAIRGAIGDAGSVASAVDIASQIRSRKSRRISFRVIARVAGRHSYRRVDVQRAVERAALERFPTWRLVEDHAQFELWVHMVAGEFLMGIRLSDITMRQRKGERINLPASLKPTIAHAMVIASEPQPDEVFLDPMCGSGTILIERAELARYKLLLGGDINPEAVAATQKNIGPRYKPIEIRQWDARHLPLADGSVSAIVTNLPFGKQIGTGEEIRRLYPELIHEWVRVLRADGRMVLLTSERDVLAAAIEREPALVVRRRIPVLVRGLEAEIAVASHRPR